MVRSTQVTLVFISCVIAIAGPLQTQELDIRSQIELAIAKQKLTDYLHESFMFHAQFNSSVLDSDGNIIKKISEIDFDVTPDKGGLIWKLIKIDGRELSESRMAKEEIDLAQNLNSRRDARTPSRRIPSLKDVADLCVIAWKRPSKPMIDKRLVLKFTARKGVSPTSASSNLLVSSDGEIHIDAATYQVLRFEGKIVRTTEYKGTNGTSLPLGSTYLFEQEINSRGIELPKRDVIRTPFGSIFHRQFFERRTEFSNYKECEISGETIERLPQ